MTNYLYRIVFLCDRALFIIVCPRSLKRCTRAKATCWLSWSLLWYSPASKAKLSIELIFNTWQSNQLGRPFLTHFPWINFTRRFLSRSSRISSKTTLVVEGWKPKDDQQNAEKLVEFNSSEVGQKLILQSIN